MRYQRRSLGICWKYYIYCWTEWCLTYSTSWEAHGHGGDVTTRGRASREAKKEGGQAAIDKNISDTFRCRINLGIWVVKEAACQHLSGDATSMVHDQWTSSSRSYPPFHVISFLLCPLSLDGTLPFKRWLLFSLDSESFFSSEFLPRICLTSKLVFVPFRDKGGVGGFHNLTNDFLIELLLNINVAFQTAVFCGFFFASDTKFTRKEITRHVYNIREYARVMNTRFYSQLRCRSSRAAISTWEAN